MSAWGSGGAWGSGATSNFRSCDALLTRVERNDPTLQELYILPNKQFGDAEIERLCRVLLSEDNRIVNWNSLSASGHEISYVSLRKLGQAIARSRVSLKHLAIGSSTMFDEGVLALVDGLLSTDGATLPLETIDLSFKGLTRTGLMAILKVAEKCPTLKTLNLSRNINLSIAKNGDDISSSASLFSPPTFSVLQELDLSDCGINASFAREFFPCLAESKRHHQQQPNDESDILKILRLSSNPLGDDGFQALLLSSGLAFQIHELNLTDCHLSDVSMEHLRSFETTLPWKCLDLTNNQQITSRGAQSLALCFGINTNGASNERPNSILCNLSELNLSSDIHIGEQGCLAILERIRHGNNLKSLDLSHTNCGALAASLALECSGLLHLRLFDNKLQSEGFQRLAAKMVTACRTFETLDLAGNHADQDAIVAILQQVLTCCLENTSDDVKLKCLVVGGNQGGEQVETLIDQIKEIRPQLDIARDKVKNSKP